MFLKIIATNAKVDKGLELACAVKVMNDTLALEGLVPPALVFGEFPRIRTPSEHQKSHPTVLERDEIATMAQG